MEYYEMEALIDNRWMKDVESWEQARTVAYITAQSQSTKQLDKKKILPFPWDRVQTEKVEDTQEDRDEMYREMKEMENKLNKKNNVND